ncbi:MAG TPA: AbrB/MazE/SpoVT family DNA-binding domain-containing protein [Geminicoccaceae bacterium]|nr:AbrB/MazE/SpoVT family DNA-binding domain-containing protein [Geminicoccaceae bacterium]
MGSRVTRKGQVTIPKRVRDYLGLAPGSIVEFDVTPDGRIVLINQDATPKPSRFEKVRGTATTKLTTDEIMAMLRGDDD